MCLPLINTNKNANSSFINLKKAVKYAESLDLEVHAGHGLTFNNVSEIAKIKEINELNIGHFIIGESISIGIEYWPSFFPNTMYFFISTGKAIKSAISSGLGEDFLWKKERKLKMILF